MIREAKSRVLSRVGPVSMVALLALLGLSRPIGAELVLLVGGGFLKVDGYHREGDQIKLLLPAGGTLSLSVLRIDRIIEDEIEEVREEELRPTAVDIDFAAGQGVPATPFGELIFAIAERHAINPQLVAAMVRAESAFDPQAVSRKGAAGLLQLMPATARRFGVSAAEVFDPERNLDAGVRYIRWLSERFDGDLPLVLAGYNAGEATVDRYRGVPPYTETRNYIRRVYSGIGAASPVPATE
jgi:hypothetical protein